MGKLMMLKEWLTLDEAAARLTATAAEIVTQADILRFAIDNHIQLSVFIVNHLTARDMAFEIEVVDGQKCFMLGEGGKQPLRIDGVWDLAAYGVGLAELERQYREQKGLKHKAGVSLANAGLYLHDEDKTVMLEALRISLKFKFVDKSVCVTAPTNVPVASQQGSGLTVNADPSMLGEISEMLKRGLGDHEPVIDEKLCSYHREDVFPEACLVVLRLKELIAFEAKHLGGSIKAELSPTERASSQQVMAVLAAMAGVDITSPYKAAEVLRKAAATSGLELPASTETIVKFLGRPAKKKT